MQSGTNISWRITVSLESLLKLYIHLLQVIQSLNDSDAQSKLKNCLETGKLHAEALSNHPDELRKEIDQYFEENRPFEWNRNQPIRLDETRVKKDWEQHEQLTVFAMLLNSREFLKKWGVDYPLGDNGSGLAGDLRNYIEFLEDIKNQYTEAPQIEYYDYLIEQLKLHPRMR